MASNIEHAFNTKANSFLLNRIGSDDTTLQLMPGGKMAFLSGWSPSKNFYATLRNAEADIEIVKVSGLSGDRLTAARGQDGTNARAWPAGSLISQRLVAANLDRFYQKGIYRTISYNPNGVLTALFPGEKVYQVNVLDCERRWFQHTVDSKWRLLAGGICSYEYFDEDGYLVTGDPDPTVINGSTEDGFVRKDNDPNWDNTHDAAYGTTARSSDNQYTPACCAYKGTNHYLYRAFLYFDLSSIQGKTISSGELHIWTRNDASGGPGISTDMAMVKGTQGSTLSTSDFSAFSVSDFFGTLYGGAYLDLESEKQATLNAASISYFQSIADVGGIAKLCLLEKDHDYYDAAPTGGDDLGYFALWFANHATQKPHLSLMV